jgi:hypothetical protein
MKLLWSTANQSAFSSSSHRARYLACDSFLNPRLDSTPLYAIQYAHHRNYPLYMTAKDCLIILEVASSFYLVKTSDMHRIAGRWVEKGKDRFKRLDPVWEDRIDNSNETVRAMTTFKVPFLFELFNGIAEYCRPGNVPSTHASRDFQGMIPRPVNPEAGVPLGTALVYDMVTTMQRRLLINPR